MKNIFFIFICTLLSTQSFAQPEEFSCINDRVFSNVETLYGYTFIPAKGKLSTSHYPVQIEKGMVMFDISPGNVEIIESVDFSPTGRKPKEEEKYKMEIARVDETSYGYKIVLVDYRDADLQGYLKIYLNDKKEAESLIFKAEAAAAEIVYYLPPMHEDYVERDALFYTHQLDHIATSVEKMKGVVLIPFAVLTAQENGSFFKFARIYPNDYTRVYFEERIKMKGKKEIKEQYITVKTENSRKIIGEFLVKKVRSLPKNGDPKEVEIEVKNVNSLSSSDKEYILIKLTPSLTLGSIEFLSLGKKFLMRRGKRKID
ncbi:MAG: hypothetical protein MK212_07040 [Saprospiraceae bacterium]|nr:hypothetical protein [Saprospiraceae bacterium]